MTARAPQPPPDTAPYRKERRRPVRRPCRPIELTLIDDVLVIHPSEDGVIDEIEILGAGGTREPAPEILEDALRLLERRGGLDLARLAREQAEEEVA